MRENREVCKMMNEEYRMGYPIAPLALLDIKAKATYLGLEKRSNATEVLSLVTGAGMA